MNNDYTTPSTGALTQFGILLAVFGGCFILGQIMIVIIAIPLLHASLFQLEAALLRPENIRVVMLLQFVGTFIGLAVPAYIFPLIIRRKPADYLGMNRKATLRQAFIVILITFAALSAQSLFEQLNEMIPLTKHLQEVFKNLDDKYTEGVIGMAQMKTPWDFIVTLVVLALLPALFEEMIFRGALQQVTISLFRNVFAGIFITGFIFSAIHFSWSGLLTRWFLGMVLGYIFYYSKNIWLNVLLHFLNNAVAVVSFYWITRNGGKLTDASMQDTPSPVYVGILAVVAIFGLFVFFKRECAKFTIVPSDAEEIAFLPGEKD